MPASERRSCATCSTHGEGVGTLTPTSARIAVAAALVAALNVAGCSAAPVSVPLVRSSAVAGSSANRVLLSLRRGEQTTAGVDVHAACQNLGSTTMTVPVLGLACVVYASAARSDEGTTEDIIMLNHPLYGGLPSGAIASTQAGRLPPGEGLQGSVHMALPPGEYSVRALIPSATPIVSVPITVNVAK